MKTKRLKRTVPFLLCLTLIVAMLSLCGFKESYVGDSKQVLENLKLTAQLEQNGDVQITETWKINFENRDRAYRNVYKAYGIQKGQENIIENLSVYDEDYKKDYKFVENIDPENPPVDLENACYKYVSHGNAEIGLFMPKIDEGVRTFTFRYKIKNMVTVYDDISEFYFQFLTNKFSLPVTKMSGTILLPNETDKKENFRTWLHCTAESRISIDSAKQISFTAEHIPAKTMVEVRVCAPNSLFPASTNKVSGNKFQTIINEEQKQANEWEEKAYWEYIVAIIDAVLGAVLIIAGIILGILAKRKSKHYKVEAPEYTREIPEGNSPAGIAHLFYYYNGGINEGNRGNLFSATMLQLARKGYLKFEDENEEIRVFLTVKALSENPSDLTKGEQEFLHLISEAAKEHDGSFNMDEFEKFSKKRYKFVDTTVEHFLNKSKSELAHRGYYEEKNTFSSVMFGLGVLFIIAAVVILFVTSIPLVYAPAGLFVAGLAMTIGGHGKPRLSKTGEYEYFVWHGLKKYMLEFSRMKEYGVPQLTLWEEYLVYATMMGISKRVTQQIELVYPEINDPQFMNTYYGNSYLYYMMGYHHFNHSSYNNMDFGSVLSNRLNEISHNATALAHPPSQNNGGSGFGGSGFGGGGGGFGGGGGGGGGGVR